MTIHSLRTIWLARQILKTSLCGITFCENWNITLELNKTFFKHSVAIKLFLNFGYCSPVGWNYSDLTFATACFLVCLWVISKSLDTVHQSVDIDFRSWPFATKFETFSQTSNNFVLTLRYIVLKKIKEKLIARLESEPFTSTRLALELITVPRQIIFGAFWKGFFFVCLIRPIFLKTSLTNLLYLQSWRSLFEQSCQTYQWRGIWKTYSWRQKSAMYRMRPKNLDWN